MRFRELPRGIPLVLLILALVCAFVPLAGGNTAFAASPAAASVQFSQNPVTIGNPETVTGCGFGTVTSVTVNVYTYPGGALVASGSPTITPIDSGTCFTFPLMQIGTTGNFTVSVTADTNVTASNVLQINPSTTPPSVTFAPNPAPPNVNVTGTICNVAPNPVTVSVTITSGSTVVAGPTNYNVTPNGSANCYAFSFVSPMQSGSYTVTVSGNTGANAFTASNTLQVSGTTTAASLQFASPVTSGASETATICGFPANLSSVSVAIVSNTTKGTVSSYNAAVTPSTAGCYTFTLTAPVALDTYTVTVTGGGTSASATLVVNTGVSGLQFVPNPASAGQTVTAYNVCGFTGGANFVVTIKNANGVLVSTQNATGVAQAGVGCFTLTFVAPSSSGSYTVTISNGANAPVSGTLVVSGAVYTPGTLSLSPSTAASGQAVVASGCGFSANDTLSITIYYFNNVFNQVAATPALVSQPVFTGGGVNGNCYSVSFIVPNLPNGTYTVTLSGSVSGTVDSGTLTINNGVCQGVNCCVNNGINCCVTNGVNCCVTTGSNCCVTNGINCCVNTVNCCISGVNCCLTTGINCCATNGVNCCVNGATCCYTTSCCLTITTATGTTTSCAASLAASSTSVAAGTTVTLTGSNFYPGAEVTISGLGATQIVANSSGTFAAALTVPVGTTPGTYTVTAADSTGRSASVQIAVTAPTGTIQASVTSTVVGTVITVTGSGFSPGEQVSLSLGAPSTAPFAIAGTVQLFTVGANGTFTAQYTVPNVAAASYDLLALGQTSRVFVFIPFTVLGTTPLSPPVSTPTPAPPATVPTPSLPSVSAGYTTTYFADGYTGTAASNGKATFTERISLYNPGSVTASVTTSYYVYDPATQGRTTVTETDSVAPGATVVRTVNQDVGDNRMVSAKVTSSAPIVAEERIDRVGASGGTLDNDSSLGSHQLGSTWYFAEGYTGITLQEYITLFNPGTAAAHAQVQYLPSGDTPAPAPVAVTVPAQGQVTINVRSQYNRLVPVGSRNIAAMVTSDTPIAVDRAMYWGDGSGSGKFGYSLAPGMTSGATTQYFALLPTSSGSQSFVTVLNPNSTAATVSLRLSDAGGATLTTVSQAVASHARYTFVVPSILPGDHGYVSGTLTSNQAVVAEGALYFGGSPNQGSHPGTIVQGTAGAQVGARADVNPRGALLRIFNPTSSSVRVQVSLGSIGGTVVYDGIVSAGGAQVVNVPAGVGARGVVFVASGNISAALINGGVGNAKAWGGSLNS